MHLICTASFELEEFTGGSIPHYAIPSHQRISEELSFQDMKSNRPACSLGYKKVQQFYKQAAQDGFQFAWVDTCCINKKSSTELVTALPEL